MRGRVLLACHKRDMDETATIAALGGSAIAASFSDTDGLVRMLADGAADAIKVVVPGEMAAIAALSATLARSAGIACVLELAQVESEAALAAFKRVLLPQASLLLLDARLAETLSGTAMGDRHSPDAVVSMARMLLTLGVPAVLLRGCVDVLATADELEVFPHGYPTAYLASAVATLLAMGQDVTEAVAGAYRHAGITAMAGAVV